MGTHTVSVSIGGAGADVAGPIRVEREENKAAIATVTVRATGGNPESWIRKSLVITFDGSTLFTGKINRPSFDATRGLLTLTASDLLQEYFEGRTEAQILTDIPNGKYSRAIFGDREDGWQQALDVLSTWPGESHLNAAGGLVVSSWTSPGGGSSAFGANGHIHGTVRPQFARGRDLTNKITLTAQVRYTRRHHREHGFSWGWGHGSFCDWYANSHTLPTREMAQSAAEGAAWAIQGPISFTALPDTGLYSCGGWAISDEAQQAFATSADWDAVRRWTQTVTETYNITISAAPSIARYGEIAQEDSGSYQDDYEDSAWDQDRNAETPSGGAWSANAIGDYYSDEIDRTAADDAIEVLVLIGKTRILETHRRNYATFDVPCNPSLDLAGTASVSNSAISANGKISQIVHSIDPISGRAITSIKIACFRGGGGSDDAIAAPTPPDTQPGYGAPASSTTLPTRIGGVAGAPAYDTDWTGYTGNANLLTGGAEVYPQRFRVVSPDVEDGARDEVESSTSETFAVGVPDDTFSVSVV